MLDFIETVNQFLAEIPFEFMIKSDSKTLNTQFYCPEKQIVIQCLCLDEQQRHSEFEMIDKTRIIRVWEDVWRTKPEIVQSRIRAIFGLSQRIPARMTKVQRIDKPILDKFLEANHLQSSVTAKLKYGLFLPPHYFRIFTHSRSPSVTQSPLLVAVATFSGSKTIVRNGEPYRSFELIRFANLLNCTVVGGMNKLLKNFIREQTPDDIMSYADRDWSDGNSYEQTDFELIGTTTPQDFWVNRHTFERITGRQKITETNPDDFIEVQNAGNLKYLLNLKKNKNQIDKP